MKKRLRKKLAKEYCLKCGNEDGVRGWNKLKTGRWVSTRLFCFNCDTDGGVS